MAGKVVVVADSFFGRWSQRKQAIKQGRNVDEPAAVKPVGTDSISPAAAPDSKELHVARGVMPNQPDATTDQATPPTPTLDDVKALNAESSFAPFVSRGVAPEVRNAAMKKLFTDPHYNVMDGLDIYIDDYSKPDPMPASMLRQLASAKFLNLFDDEAAAVAGASTTPLAPQTDVHPVTVVSDTVGESAPVLSDTPSPASPNLPPDTLPAPCATGFPAQVPHHDHTDLRLQPNDAAGQPQSERVPE
jgi:hypothetical protein